MPQLRIFLVLCFSAVMLTGNYCITFGRDSLPYNTQSTDTLKAGTSPSDQESGISNVDDEEFNIALLLFATAAICVMIGFFVAGMLAFLLLLLLFAAFIATGIISASVLTGLYKRSLTSGFKTFMLISGSILGLMFGIFVMGIVSLLFKLNFDRSTIAIGGGLSGILAGAMLGLSVFRLLKIGLIFLGKKLHINSKENAG